MDSGEDQPDDSPEYGGCVACHGFRREETEFLEQMVARKDYQHPEIHTRLIISHMPFTQLNVPPFDIEQLTYRRWTNLVAQMNPDLILCGHAHVAQIRYPGCQEDAYGQPCPVVIGSGFADQKRIWIGCGIAFSKGKLELTFTDSNGNVIETQRIENDHE